MAITASQAQGLVLALFGASAGGHLTALKTSADAATLAGDLASAAGLILGQDLSSDEAFRDLIIDSNLKLTGAAQTEAKAWMDGEFAKGTSRADILTAAITFLEGLTDETNAFYATAVAYRTTVADAVTWSEGAGATVLGVTALREQQGNVEEVAGSSFTLTTSTSDVLLGTAGNDTFSGANATGKTVYSDTDRVIDSSTTDNDTYNLTVIAAATPDVSNVENTNVTLTSVSAIALTASGMTGVKNLTVSRGDLTVGDATIAGNKKVDVQTVRADKVAKITAGAGTTDLTVVQATKAGITVDGNTATGNVDITGAGTFNVDGAGATKTVTVRALNDSTEDAKAVVVNAAKAGTVTVADNTLSFTGAVTVNAAAATTVSVAAASGGATINAAKATSITVSAGVDDSGVTINAGTFASTDTGINIAGTSATSDVATVSAAGTVNLVSNTTAQVDTLNLSGNGAAVKYVLTASAAATNVINLTGTQDVTIKTSSANLAGVTVNDNTTAGTTTAEFSTVATADVSKVSLDVMKLAGNGTSQTLTYKSGQNFVAASDQTTGITFTGKTTKATVTIDTADDSAGAEAAPEIDLVAVTTTKTETINLVTTGAKLSLDSIASDVTTGSTVNASGAKQLTIKAISDAEIAAVSAANMTGKLVIGDATEGGGTAGITSTGLLTVIGGAGNDVVEQNASAVVTHNYGAGDDAAYITAASQGSLFLLGDGADTAEIRTANNIVVQGGAGNDTITIKSGVDTDAILIGGDGNDTLVFSQAGASIDLSDSGNANFAFSGFENLDISALDSASYSVKLSAAQIGTQTLTVKGTASGSDLLKIAGTSAANTIDLSNVTLSNALLTVDAGAGADIVTGTAGNDTLNGDAGADTINGGAGNDAITGGDDADAINGGAGNDTIYEFTLGDTVDGGANTDTLSISVTSTALTNASDAALVNVEEVTAAGAVTLSLATQTEAFVINSYSAGDSLQGGSGNDTIKLVHAAANQVHTVVFAGSAALNGTDTITGLEAGTSATDGEKLDFTAFVTGRLVDAGGSANTGTTAVTEFDASSTGEENINGKVVVFNNGGTALTATTLAAEFADGTGGGTTASFQDTDAALKAVVIEGNSAGSAPGYIWYIDSSLDGTAANVTAADIKLVGILGTNIDIDTITGNQIL